MNRHMRLVVAAILVLVLLLTSVAVASAAPPHPFRGPWHADDIDGSYLRLVFGGGHGTRRITWRDDYWSLCDGGRGIGRGTGMIDSSDSNVLHSTLDFYCGKSKSPVLTLDIDFVYDPSTNTMVNVMVGGGPGEVTWYR